MRLADYTAGREFHPALKMFILYTCIFSLTIAEKNIILTAKKYGGKNDY